MELQWTPGIGDPTVSGWLTVFAYFTAAVLSLRVWRQARFSDQKFHRETSFWAWAAIALIAFGINKQLDLQSLFTELARMWAKQDGWYNDRRTVQKMAIALMVAGIGAAALLVFYLLRKASAEAKIGAIGLAMVFAFVLIRAASFHHVDAFIRSTFWGFDWNTILEVPGILIIAFCAARLVNKNINKIRHDAEIAEFDNGNSH